MHPLLPVRVSPEAARRDASSRPRERARGARPGQARAGAGEKDKAAAESALSEKSQQLAEAQEFSRLTETRLEELRVKPTQWLEALKCLNFEMAGKPPCSNASTFFFFFFFCTESVDSD